MSATHLEAITALRFLAPETFDAAWKRIGNRVEAAGRWELDQIVAARKELTTDEAVAILTALLLHLGAAVWAAHKP